MSATSPSAIPCCSATNAAPTPSPISRSATRPRRSSMRRPPRRSATTSSSTRCRRGLSAGGCRRPDRQRLRPRGAAAAADGVRGRGAEAAGDQPGGERGMSRPRHCEQICARIDGRSGDAQSPGSTRIRCHSADRLAVTLRWRFDGARAMIRSSRRRTRRSSRRMSTRAAAPSCDDARSLCSSKLDELAGTMRSEA